MRKIRIAPGVYDDLTGIYKWIAQDSPANAASFVHKLTTRINRLNDTDYPGTPRDDLLPGIRRVNVGDFAILFRFKSEEIIEVLQVVHGSRNLPRRIRPPDESLQ